MADLLAEAASPVPKFAGVICEDIERCLANDTSGGIPDYRRTKVSGIRMSMSTE